MQLDIDCIGYNNETPIFVAAKYNAVAALGVLIERFGSTSLPNADGESPLHIACRHGNIQTCQVCQILSKYLKLLARSLMIRRCYYFIKFYFISELHCSLNFL